MSYNLGVASGSIEINGRGASKGFEIAQVAAEGFFGVIQSKLDTLKTLSNYLIGIGAAGSTGMGLAIKTAADYQQQISALGAVAGASSEQMEQLRAKGLQLGADTAFSATQAAEAMTELAKAGLPVEAILNGAADAAVALAAAGEISLAEAAQIASNAMNQFNLTAEDMPRVADLISGAANASAIDVSEFGMSLSQAGAVANIAGLSFDDLAVAIAEMGNAGIKGSDAGTSLKTFLMNLQPVTDKQVDTFRELGILVYDNAKAYQFLRTAGIKPLSTSQKDVTASLKAFAAAQAGAKVGSKAAEKQFAKLITSTKVMRNEFFDAKGDVKSMAEIQEVLKKATKGMTAEQKTATLEVMFGSDAIRAAAILTEEGADGFNKLATAMGKVKAADVAAKKLDNLKGAVEQFKGSMETMLITIGNVFLPMVQKVVEAGTWLVNLFNKLPSPIQTFIAVVLGMGSALSLFLGVMIKSIFWLGPLFAKMMVFRALGVATGAIRAFFGALMTGQGISAAGAASMTVLNTAWLKINKTSRIFIGLSKAIAAAWAIASGPWGWAALAIAAVGVALYELYQRWQPFQDFVNGMATGIKTKLMPYLDELRGLLEGSLTKAAEELSKAWRDEILPAFKDVWGTIQRDVIPALRDLWTELGPIAKEWLKIQAALGGGLLTGLFQIAKFILTKIVPALVAFHAFMLKTFVGAFKVVMGFIKSYVIPILVGFISFITNTVIPGIVSFASGVKGAFLAVWEFLAPILATIRDLIVSAFTVAKDIVTTTLSVIYEVVVGVFSIIWAILQPILQMIWDFFVVVWTAIATVVGGAVRGILAVIQAVWSAIYPYVSAVWNAVKEVISTVWNAIKAVIDPIINWIQTTIFSKFDAVEGKTEGIWNTIKGVFSTVWNAIKTAVATGVATIKTAIEGMKTIPGKVRSFFEEAKKAVSTKMGEVVTFMRGIPAKIISALGSLASTLYSAGSDLIGGLISGITGRLGELWSTISGIAGGIKDKISGILQISSPSKVMRTIGVYIVQGIAAGLRSGNELVQTEISAITSRIVSLFKNKKTKEAVKKAVWDIIAAATPKLNKLQGQLAAVRDKLADAERALADAKRVRDDYAKSIAESVTATGNAVDIFASQASSGMVPTIESINRALADKVAQASRFRDTIQQLIAKGLNTSIIETLVRAGYGDAAQVAELLNNATPEQLATFQALQAQLNEQGQALGSSVAEQMYGAGVQAAQGLVDGLKSKEAALIKQIEVMVAQIIAAIKRKLKIRSPSQIMENLGEMTGAGLVGGLEGQLQELDRMSRSMARSITAPIVSAQGAMAGAASVPSTPATTPVQNTTVVNINSYNPVAEPTSVTTKNTMTRLAVLGVV